MPNCEHDTNKKQSLPSRDMETSWDEGTQKPHLVPNDSCTGTAVTSPEGLEVQVVSGVYVCASLESVKKAQITGLHPQSF